MYDAYEELENTCERAIKELHDLNKKTSKEENTVSRDDIEMMESLTHTIASCKKGIAMMDKYDDNGYSGVSYNTQPTWNRRYANNGSSGRRGGSRSRGYSRDNGDIMQRLNAMYQDARDDQEADMIQSIMNELR